MSDITATNCGCGCENSCGDGRVSNFFGGDCCSIIWIILLLSCCGGNGFGTSGANSCGDNSCLWIILLLFCCGGNGFGC